MKILTVTELEAIHVIFLAKNPAAFCLCPENLPEAKLESKGLISLVEKIQDYLMLELWYDNY